MEQNILEYTPQTLFARLVYKDYYSVCHEWWLKGSASAFEKHPFVNVLVTHSSLHYQFRPFASSLVEHLVGRHDTILRGNLRQYRLLREDRNVARLAQRGSVGCK